ncbi:isocitrate lyase/phosphoenolpyruvate mutase family protein, partial [Streptomyces sp. NPDC005904]
MTTHLREAALAFRALHTAGRPLVLPNAWDAASARVIEAAGARAIATTSA